MYCTGKEIQRGREGGGGRERERGGREEREAGEKTKNHITPPLNGCIYDTKSNVLSIVMDYINNRQLTPLAPQLTQTICHTHTPTIYYMCTHTHSIHMYMYMYMHV